MLIKNLNPVWILNTRSFWLGIAPAALTLIDTLFSDSGGPVAQSIYYVIGQFFSWTPDDIQGVMQSLAPIYALIVAQQRSGITRPYSVTPVKVEDEAAVLVKGVSVLAAPSLANSIQKNLTSK